VIRIPPSEITLGKRLAYDVLDQHRRLLLLRGRAIASGEQAEAIRQTGYRGIRPRKFTSTFTGMSQLAGKLASIEKDFLERRDFATWSSRVEILVHDIIELSDGDPDAAFACIHLEVVHPYTVVHHLMAALVCARLGLAKGLDHPQRFSLVAAALTHDIAILAAGREIAPDEQLDPQQRARIKRHAVDGVRILGEMGVADPLWLNAVRDHHEYLDGSGYAGKQGDEISLPARILSLADSYSAMLRPRPYRDRVVARAALEDLYTTGLIRYDSSLVEILIWDMGFYPPGSLLKLANRELAIAIHNTPGILDSPQVAALTDPLGRPLVKPFIRDTRNPKYAITGALDPSMATRAARLIEQCWILQPPHPQGTVRTGLPARGD
jgi:HD-GYP domain-containing protein (c-di-GMP phosphodiesterase class II)